MASLRDADPDRTRVNGKPLDQCSREELADAVRMLVRHVVDLELRVSPPPPAIASGGLAGVIGGPGGVTWGMAGAGPAQGAASSGGAGGSFRPSVSRGGNAGLPQDGGSGPRR